MTQRLLLLLVAFGLIFGAALVAPDLADAQPTAIDLRKGGATGPSPDLHPHSDLVEGSGKGLALLFWAFAAATVGGALFVVTRKNLIAAVMGMVGSFLGISAIYMMLYASFLSVIQMLVYAGAIMVLFVFVIMILNRPEDDPIGRTGRLGKVLAGVAILYLFARLASLLMSVRPLDAASAAAVPPPVDGNAWGSTKAVGIELFTNYVFPFEAISILLLVAVVGAIAIARPLRDDAAQEGA
ncbi:MAG: NADH-quinone oxidoreductase subunit J [Myxococcales bacterium]|nr:NADH-quinone oxidoreductase subunit J [Myxococcales bacterium]